MTIVSDKSGRPIQVTIAWVLTVFTLGYFLPWAIAATRGKVNTGAIAWLNLLLGWTLIGWIVALVMACGAHQVVAFQQPVPAQQFTAAVPPPPAAPAPALPAPLPVGTAEGWFDDGTGQLRWWNGAGWTEHVHQPEPPTTPSA